MSGLRGAITSDRLRSTVTLNDLRCAIGLYTLRSTVSVNDLRGAIALYPLRRTITSDNLWSAIALSDLRRTITSDSLWSTIALNDLRIAIGLYDLRGTVTSNNLRSAIALYTARSTVALDGLRYTVAVHSLGRSVDNWLLIGNWLGLKILSTSRRCETSSATTEEANRASLWLLLPRTVHVAQVHTAQQAVIVDVWPLTSLSTLVILLGRRTVVIGLYDRLGRYSTCTQCFSLIESSVDRR